MNNIKQLSLKLEKYCTLVDMKL